MAALLLDQWCLHTFQCLSKILSPNRRRRKGASSIGRCLHPPIPTTSGKICKCIFFTDWNPYTTFCAHSHTLLVDLPILKMIQKPLAFLFYGSLQKQFFLQHTLHWLGEFKCLKTNTCRFRHNFILPGFHTIYGMEFLFFYCSQICVLARKTLVERQHSYRLKVQTHLTPAAFAL